MDREPGSPVPLGRILPNRLTGSEPLHDRRTPVGGSVLDFWQWAGSDLIANTFRGWVAEYIVARALGITGGVRVDWLAYDLEADGIEIEVKTSAYVQSWAQRKFSTPQLSIRPARAWDPDTDTMTNGAARRSDVATRAEARLAERPLALQDPPRRLRPQNPRRRSGLRASLSATVSRAAT